MKSLLLILGIQLLAAAHAATVREDGGNCVGVKSCRPRCATFRLERNVERCGTSQGIFNVQEDLNPWDTKRFKTRNCETNNSCENSQCGLGLAGDLTVRVGEEGHTGSFYYSKFDLPAAGDDIFTFCSIYPCTKEECALPEQMGFAVQFSFFQGSVGLEDFTPEPLLVLEFYLKAAFVGSPLQSTKGNRYGPLHVEWMDDPAGCRGNEFSEFAPVAPELDPPIFTSSPGIDTSLFCEGEEYLPSDLPGEQPTAQPSHEPSFAPTLSTAPSSAPTNSAIGIGQLDGLMQFYTATKMDSAVSKGRHNWFVAADYCRWTGITCDDRGFVIKLNVQNVGLAGSLPASMDDLNALRQLNVFNNRIGGTIPEYLCDLSHLTQLELATNLFWGPIPSCLHNLRFLRRLMLQYNLLYGEIPHKFCQFNQLEAFDISYNLGMYGEIPQCMGSLPLDILRVDNVGLVGQVPPQLCARENINLLTPNPYGCDAIACPAGKFQPKVGRTSSDDTICQTCDFPSNVIGSTTCRLVQNNTVISATAAPSAEPSVSPSLAPGPVVESAVPTESMVPTMKTSASPSFAPVLDELTLEPSAAPTSDGSSMPSVGPTSSPSLLPSVVPSDSPSISASGEPSDSPSLGLEVISLTVIFSDIQAVLDEDSIEVFENKTKAYLGSNSTTIEKVTILNQSVGGTAGGVRSRRLEEDLAIEMEIEGRSEEGSLENDVESLLVGNFSDYSNILRKSLPALVPIPTTPSAAPIVIEQQNEDVQRDKKTINWGLIGAAIALSFVALVVVVVVLKAKNRDKEEVRAFPVEQTAVSGGAPTQPQQPGVDDALSAESSGGWNSESSPGEFVNDHTVQEWTPAKNRVDAYVASKHQNSMIEEVI